MVLHGRGHDGLEGGRHADHGMTLGLVGPHGRLGIGAKALIDEAIVEVVEEPVHLADGTAGEGAEHKPTHPALVLGQARLVASSPTEDAGHHRGGEHALAG